MGFTGRNSVMGLFSDGDRYAQLLGKVYFAGNLSYHVSHGRAARMGMFPGQRS